MSVARYERVSNADERLPAGSGSSDSQLSARLTPDSESDDDGRDDLGTLEEDEGLELRELKLSSSSKSHSIVREQSEQWNQTTSSTSQGKPNGEKGVDEDDEAWSSDGEDEADGEAEKAAGDHRIEHGLTSRHTRSGSVASFELYTPDEERRVRYKLDTRLVLFVALLYMMSFLDRSNIGNAKVAGLTTDLRLSDDQFSWLLSAFYITYILFEWMTLCYRLFPAHIYIACCVLAWGVIASLQSLTTSFAYILVLRAMLGVAEAAFVGMPFFLSFFFRREELALRVGLFISAAPLAEAFASSLAYAIVSLGDRTGVASWRLLFALEGFPACIVAVWTWFWIPDGPSTARWLTPRERRVATLRVRNESAAAASDKTDTTPRYKRKFRWSEVVKTLADPKSYLTAGMFFCCNVAFSSMPVFLPSIVHSMGYSALASQGLSAPPFLFAFFVVLLTAVLSDRFQSRSVPMIFHAALALSGYVFAALASTLHLSPVWRYLAVYPICAGFFSAVTVVITWTINNQASDEGKGTGMAVLNVFGQMGPLLGTRLYPDADKPYYINGNVVCAVAMAMVALLAYALRKVLQRENARWRRNAELAEGEALVADQRKATKGFVYII